MQYESLFNQQIQFQLFRFLNFHQQQQQQQRKLIGP